jgi:hypothetical protein
MVYGATPTALVVKPVAVAIAEIVSEADTEIADEYCCVVPAIGNTGVELSVV